MANTEQRAAHTPGPWRAIKVAIDAQCGGYVVLWPDTGKPGVHHRRLDYKGEFLAADATLIAAAPDLLEALKQICSLEHTENNEWGAVERLIPEMTRIARAAIARATGEAQS
jgi:hypothetical protein